jgi:hypothetical protein
MSDINGSGNTMTRARIIIGAVAGLAVVTAATAAVPGKEYFVIGGGGGMVVHANPCPDITCNSGDTCSCVSGSGSLKVSPQLGGKVYNGTYTLEVSADNSATNNNGGNGTCFASTGKFKVTLPAGTLEIPFSGPGCRIPGVPDTAEFGISAPAVLGNGTGYYSGKSGTGTFAGSFSPTNATTQFDLVAYGDLK